MADPTQEPINAGETPAPDTPVAAPITRRKRRKKSLKIDKAEVVRQVLEGFRKDSDDRIDRIDRRIARYAKLRGWLDTKDWPWANCSNLWLPVMLTASLRMKATLENAVKSTRPVMQAKARQRRNEAKTAKIDKVLDFQVFSENDGERKIDAFISNFIDDEVAYAHVHWVKDEQTIVETKVLDPFDETLPYIAQALQSIKIHMPEGVNAVMKDKQGYSYEAAYTLEGEDVKANIEFYDRDDGRIDMCIHRRATTFNGPAFEVLDFEDVVFPIRSANLQPPNDANPLGAPYVNRVCKASVDSIRRGKERGVYDLLTDEDMDAIVAGRSDTGTGSNEDRPKEQKDMIEGTETGFGTRSPNDRQIIEHYGRWDIDGDGLEEDVIFTIETSAQVLLRARLLTEIYPGIPIRRPFAHESFIPIPNRVIGLSLGELLEPFQDAMKTLMDQHIDWGTITNIPWFAYRAASGFKPEPIMLQPGEGIPLDDPARDLAFPQFPSKDSGFALNTMAVLQQFTERIAMINDASYGRVPTGKASALRTVGTTMALLQQTDVRAEQTLRRLFQAIAVVYQICHSLNRRYLPPMKEFRVVGVAAQGEQAYDSAQPDDIDADVDFEFKATLLNTNKQQLQQQLAQLMAVLISPIALQLGVVSPEQIYNLYADYIKSADLDHERYTRLPPGVIAGPKISAEDAMSAIIGGQAPIGLPKEPAIEHFQKMIAFTQDPRFALLDQTQLAILQVYLQHIQMQIIQEAQQQLMLAQMAGGGAGQPQGNQGPGGAPTTMQAPGMDANPPVQKNETIDESVNMQ